MSRLLYRMGGVLERLRRLVSLLHEGDELASAVCRTVAARYVLLHRLL